MKNVGQVVLVGVTLDLIAFLISILHVCERKVSSKRETQGYVGNRPWTCIFTQMAEMRWRDFASHCQTCSGVKPVTKMWRSFQIARISSSDMAMNSWAVTLKMLDCGVFESGVYSRDAADGWR